MKEYFVLGDTHSFYTELRAALRRNGFKTTNPEHIVILCGDMLDRGDESEKCVNFFYKLFKQNRLIFVRGNHEDLFVDMVSRGIPWSHDYSNGTVKTYRELYYAKNKKEYDYDEPMSFNDITPKWKELIDNSVNYYETKNYIFVHGWYPTFLERSDWDAPKSKRVWADARWENGMEMAENGFIIDGKTTVCGHWHTSYGNVRKMYPNKSSYRYLEFSEDISKRKLMGIYRNKGIIAVDACTAWSGFCNCLKLKEDEI